MLLFYGIALKFYYAAIFIASFFNHKAKQWIEGRRNIFQRIKTEISKSESGNKIIWFHCSSFGEYEQGKPVLEMLKQKFPHHKVLLTFFSPSGYVQGIKKPIADFVFYLPVDSHANAKEFISLVKPSAAFFVKYDFWFYYMQELSRNKIPFYYVSAIFRNNHYFFKWYGRFFLRQLKNASHFFVQDAASKKLLNENGIQEVSVTGDTRYDKVAQNFKNAQPLPLIEKFVQDKRTVVAGSIWAEDEKLLLQYINQYDDDIKFLVVPHEISKLHIARFISQCAKKCKKYSEISAADDLTENVLVVDAIGILSNLYRYATIAYIGGGFGKGIHNILEAAVFGAPVVFGSNYKKFNEAEELINLKGAFPVTDYPGMKKILDRLLNSPGELGSIKTINTSFTSQKTGATMMIEEYIVGHLK